MKSSIIVAIIIFLAVIGWIGSGQITNVSAQDDAITTNKQDVSAQDDAITTNKQDVSVSSNEEIIDKKTEEFFSVETKIFISNLIDQSIELQGQTIHHKKIDVKSETSGNINKLNS